MNEWTSERASERAKTKSTNMCSYVKLLQYKIWPNQIRKITTSFKRVKNDFFYVWIFVAVQFIHSFFSYLYFLLVFSSFRLHFAWLFFIFFSVAVVSFSLSSCVHIIFACIVHYSTFSMGNRSSVTIEVLKMRLTLQLFCMTCGFFVHFISLNFFFIAVAPEVMAWAWAHMCMFLCLSLVLVVFQFAYVYNAHTIFSSFSASFIVCVCVFSFAKFSIKMNRRECAVWIWINNIIEMHSSTFK